MPCEVSEHSSLGFFFVYITFTLIRRQFNLRDKITQYLHCSSAATIYVFLRACVFASNLRGMAIIYFILFLLF